MSNPLDYIRIERACPPDKVVFLPPEIAAGLDVLDAVAIMKRHGIMSEQIYRGVCKEVTDAALRAAREGRVTMIANVRP